MTTRNYSSRSQQTTLTSAVTAGASSIVVVSGTALLGGVTIPAGTTFTIVIDPDTAIEEIVDATQVSTNTFTVTRAIDGSSAQAHSAGAVVRHMAIGRDYRESNAHIEASTGVHGISNSSSVVGTIDTQTLTNKTLTAPTITNPSISGAGVDASIVFEGATPDAFETTLTVVDPTQDNTLTLPNTTGTVVVATAVQTLTNKTLTSPTISGSPVITGLSSAGMSASSATPKDYVDSILGSATAAATSAASAATSATSAATSATSAASSASASASSATASASSATASATSATASATSASAAATSATSAATSASAAATSASSAATSATSAAASATTAAASVATIAGYATTASNSASAAATSAASAATSASSAAASAASIVGDAAAAATSAASASTSAASALTSATSANSSAITAAASVATIAGYATTASNSASAAATSAASASTSASSASTDAASAATSASSALTSATSAATTYDNFDDRYLGAKSTPPTLDNDGNALITGALYWNSVSNEMFAWTGSAWGSISSTAAIFRYRYTASGGETSESGPDDNGVTLSYLPGKEQVYLNGVLLVRGQDYTASNGTSIASLSPALSSGDVLEIITFTAFDLATAIPNTIFDAKGDLIVASAADTAGKLTVGTDGQVLTAASTTALGLTWVTPAAGYSAPTLGTTAITSGATVTNVNGLTINSTTIPTSATLLTSGGALGTPSSGTLTNASGLPISTGVSGLGTGIATALAVGVGSAGAPVVNGGALGTPSSGTLTSATGLPVSTGISGLGTGVATALAVNVGSAGAPVVNGGALGTPSSGTLTNATGLPLTGTTGTLGETRGGTNNTAYTTGDILYASGTNTLAKRTIGSTGQVLTVSGGVPTWAAAAVNPSYTLIATSSPNGTSALTFSSLSGYSSYFIVMYPATIGVGALRINFNSDTGSNYVYTVSSTGLTQSSTSDTAIRFGYAGSNSTTFYGGIEINGANSAGKKVVQSISGGGSGADAGVTYGYWNGTGTITSITISTGNTFNANAFFHLLGA